MKRTSPLLAKLLIPGIAVAIWCMAPTAWTSTWTGTPGNWSSNGSPGWNGTGVPNSQGAVAEYLGTSSATITQDIALGVTVGTIRTGGTGNASLTLTITNPITLDQDGAGSGSALIENARSVAGGYRLNLSAGTITLADNLIIRNTSASTSTSGGINIASNIGGTGNITFENVSNNTGVNQIVLGGTNTSNFTGNVLVRKGAVTFNDKDHFGNQATNVITLGESGQGSATLVSSATVTGAVINNIVVATGTTGTTVLGSISTAASGTTTYSGNVTLNGDLSLTSANPTGGNVTLSGIVSGTGALTKVDVGIARLAAVNTYTGNTTVSAGTLLLVSGGEQRFNIQNANVSNKFLGTGTVDFGGILRLDITGLTSTSGTWNLIDVTNLTETFGGSFGLKFTNGTTFTSAGGGNFTSGNWTFSEGTGNLVLVPEPATFGLLGLGGLLLVVIRGRRREAIAGR